MTGASQGLTQADVDRIDNRILKLLELIVDRVYQIEKDFLEKPSPIIGPPVETPYTEPVLPPATSFKSRVRGLVTSSSQAAASMYERREKRESPQEQWIRKDKQVEDTLVRRSVVTVPVSDIVRGIVNRGTTSRLAEEAPPLVTPEEMRQLEARYKIVPVELERFSPFLQIEEALERLRQLSRSHFHFAAADTRRGTTHEGGAPSVLYPIGLFTQQWSWPPRPDVRRDLIGEFVATCRQAAKDHVAQAIGALTARVTQIERYPKIRAVEEGGGAIRT